MESTLSDRWAAILITMSKNPRQQRGFLKLDALVLQKASMGMGTFYIWQPLQVAVHTAPHV